MTIRFSENRLGLIGAQSTRWPDATVSIFWRHAHGLITALVERARSADQEIDAIERNRDLSEVGRLKATGEAALRSINSLEDLAELRNMEEQAARDIDMFDKKKGDLPKAGTDVNSAAMGVQIRDRISAQGDALGFALKLKADPVVVAAVAVAPAFLSGLTQEQKTIFIREAEGVLWPDAAGRIAQINKALDHARDTVSQVRKMIADRGQLLETLGSDGVRRWELPNGAKAA